MLSNKTTAVVCSNCGSSETHIYKTGRREWRLYEGNLFCSECYAKATNSFTAYKRMDKSNRICCECQSTTTYTNEMGYQFWYKNGRGEYMCSRCIKVKTR